MGWPFREPFVKKHIHSWVRTDKRYETGGGLTVERKCSECGQYQNAFVPPVASVPDSVIHLADVPWFDGKMVMIQMATPYWPIVV